MKYFYNKQFTLLILTITIFFWSTTFMCIKIALPNNSQLDSLYTPGALALFRTVISFLTMLVIFYFNHSRIIFNLRYLINLAVTGIIGFGVYNLTLNYGEMRVPAYIAGFVIGQTPIFATILARVFLKETLSRFNLLGMAIGFLGLLIIFLSNATNFHMSTQLLFICATTICGAVYSISQKKLLEYITPVEIVTHALFFATVFLLPFSWDLFREIDYVSFKTNMVVVYSGIFPGAIAYCLWSYVLTKITVSKAMSFFYLFPLISCLSGYLLIHETINTCQLFGAVISLVGALIFNYSNINR